MGLQEATDKLKAAMEKALAEVKRLQDLRKSHSGIKQLHQWPNMHKAVQQAKASLDNIAMAAGDFHLVVSDSDNNFVLACTALSSLTKVGDAPAIRCSCSLC